MGRADSGLRAGAHLGWVLRDEASFANLAVDDALRWGLAAELPLVARVRLLAELVGEIPVLADGATSEETPTELLLGGRWDLGDLALHAVVGTGLVKGFGTPSFRGAIGAAWGQIPNPDLDDDGILNKVDRCPTDPEDLDGFEDDDGCPDLDNDDDGILDDDDACENRPEDVDGFRDSDGCPDPDNDDDGIPDEADACPDDPEDVDGFEDSDGCPDPDNDGDGVPDIEDLCPDAAEDLDGFEDTNGCPDFDNDADGIPDTEDACPDQAETINGVEDFDGCPDEAPIALRFAESRIVVTGTLDFVPRGTAPTPESDPVIEAIARAMRTWPDIRLVIVVTSTEKKDRARDLRFAEDRANALRDVLVARGIDAWRITARGTGWGDVAEGVTPDPAPSVTTLELQR